MTNEHSLLKFFIPLLSLAYGIGLSLLSSIVIDENEFYVHQYLTRIIHEFVKMLIPVTPSAVRLKNLIIGIVHS